MPGEYSYDYPRAAVTADVAVLRLNEVPEILLIQRKDPPFSQMWALPGGFMEMEETLEAAARRELMEETGIRAGELIRFDSYDRPGRDPRGRTITQVFVMIWKEEMGIPVAGSDASGVQWFGLTELPALAFDHKEIVSDVIRMIKEGNQGKPITK
ncbi:MAG: NUDIX hydrolase [Bacteroidales bacterium]|nr:NUDIX hydrolase [Bacteroidales bacterium]